MQEKLEKSYVSVYFIFLCFLTLFKIQAHNFIQKQKFILLNLKSFFFFAKLDQDQGNLR